MNKATRAIGAAMLCLGMLAPASAVFATQDPAPEKPKKEQKMKTTMINGTVSAVTDSTVTIVDSKQAEHVLAVTSETKVTKNGKDAVLADVKANDVVMIEAQKGDGNTWTALKITVS